MSVLPQLTEALFELMQTVGNEDVVQTLDTLIEHHGEHMAPYAVQVVTLLATQFLEKFDEQGQGDDDDLEMTMMSLMQAISTMMDAVSSQPTIFPSLEAALLPLLERLTRVEGEDYFEDALELLSYLTYYSPNISPGLWSLYPRLHAAYLSFAKEHTNSIITPLDNYISRGTDAFLGLEGGRYVGMLLEMARAALITYSDDQGDAESFDSWLFLENGLGRDFHAAFSIQFACSDTGGNHTSYGRVFCGTGGFDRSDQRRGQPFLQEFRESLRTAVGADENDGTDQGENEGSESQACDDVGDDSAGCEYFGDGFVLGSFDGLFRSFVEENGE